MGRSILFVDDERQILKALRREFLETHYNVFFANSGYEALEILKNNEIDLIITDMRMPIMDGYELLKQVKKMYPKIKRVVLSGYFDENLMKDSINNGLTEFYILKPWRSREIITSIEKVLG